MMFLKFGYSALCLWAVLSLLIMACAESEPAASPDRAPRATEPSPAAASPTPVAVTQEAARKPGTLPVGLCAVSADEMPTEDDFIGLKWRDNYGGGTDLHVAARDYGRAMVVTLLNEGADADARDDDGRTPLHWTFRRSSRPETPEVVRALIECGGIDPNAEALGGWTHLHTALHGVPQDVAVVQELLDLGADPNATTTVTRLTPLHNLVDSDEDLLDPAVVRALLEAGADPNAKDYLENTPLHIASTPAAVKALLEGGADPNLKDDSGSTPLHRAREHATLSLMLEAGGDPNARNDSGSTPLHRAQDSAMILALLEAGADIEARGYKDRTPLQLFMEWASMERFITLLEAGADPNVRDDRGITLLHKLQYSPGPDEARMQETLMPLLLDAGADPNARDDDGRTPLHFAIAPVGTQILLDAGADLTAEANDGRTPLQRYLDATETSRNINRMKPLPIHAEMIQLLTPPVE